MRISALLQKSAVATSITVFLQLATSTNGFGADLLPVSGKDTTDCITAGKTTKIDTNGQASSKTTLMIKSTQITSSMVVRSLASKGRSKRAGLHDYQALTGNWKQLSQFRSITQRNALGQSIFTTNLGSLGRKPNGGMRENTTIRYFPPTNLT